MVIQVAPRRPGRPRLGGGVEPRRHLRRHRLLGSDRAGPGTPAPASRCPHRSSIRATSWRWRGAPTAAR